ncbi:carbamoylphosphate synthase large subunit short form [Clostridia bacterium]|nr:carbamoylphosphate synthase large subunit short form [Clostridia bacterium]
MNNEIGVLVFPAGEINSVELHDALAACVNVRVYGASSIERHGGFVFKNYIGGVPMLRSPDFISAINKIIVDHSIDVIIPTHDDVALFLADNQNSLNAKILTCDRETAETCRDKKLTYEMFRDYDFCPKTFSGAVQFPVFIKPRKGQGGAGSQIVRSRADVPSGLNWSDYVICEYLPGEELTVDCFTDKDGTLRAILPRSRQRVFGGVSVSGQNETLTTEIERIADTINYALRFLGLWYFQIKRDTGGNFKLLEISARCAGTMCLSRVLGVNLPLLSVYAAIGRKTEVFKNTYNVIVDRTLISRYKTNLTYESVYIDFDDTIIIGGKVNLQAVRFLYQCVNEGKRVILITRHSASHSDSVYDTMKRHKISADLFSEIAELGISTPKYTAIKEDGAIFIDNAYAERKEIFEKLNIPVFDVSEIEVLLDWRT